MASTNILRLRRSLAQRHALEAVEREIRSNDPFSRRKYLRDFSSAYQTYDSVINRSRLFEECHAADIVLVGDYHALPASQRFAAELLPTLAEGGRQLVLGVEFIFARHQQFLDQWFVGDVASHDLRDRIRFDLDWGYDWQPYYELLNSARNHAQAVWALDCTPRGNLRRISTRDRHAASRIAQIREKYPEALVLVLFGESHLAPGHLPGALRNLRPQDRVLTVLQNNDNLYWKSAGEPSDRVEAVRVKDNVVCVFTSTPLEKYESYRSCIERWRQEGSNNPDGASAIYNMVSALLRFLSIDACSPTTGTSAGSLLGEMPAVVSVSSDKHLRRAMCRRGAEGKEVRDAIARLQQNGTCFVASLNSVFVREFNLATGAEEATRFVHHTCRGPGAKREAGNAADRFYGRVLEEALAYFGSRALYPSRTPVRESELYSLYSQDENAVEQLAICSYRDYMQMVDFLVLHRDYEADCSRYRERPALLDEGTLWEDKRREFVTRWLGRMLGSDIYDAYVRGNLGKRSLRSLFVRRLDKPEAARTAYFVTARKLRSARARRTRNVHP